MDTTAALGLRSERALQISTALRVVAIMQMDLNQITSELQAGTPGISESRARSLIVGASELYSRIASVQGQDKAVGILDESTLEDIKREQPFGREPYQQRYYSDTIAVDMSRLYRPAAHQ